MLFRFSLFLVSNKQQVKITNYSLDGKARHARPSTHMQSKQGNPCCNVANYANREATAETKCHLKWSDDGKTLTIFLSKDF